MKLHILMINFNYFVVTQKRYSRGFNTFTYIMNFTICNNIFKIYRLILENIYLYYEPIRTGLR